ncbi:hypothetical protein CC1G_00532 [Coprinopsis cinerea okayama7|uniref:F-box domain-containing protein n=1 Tax=Coprinopsis cinerea (strain Okayama-7 / 130 / ATCC MYA-4618 / FGSC 9003) TaxID=240176 RepID=A8N3A8_COPC7|nr:hypothetical protein CC1G_00532 [Coprinopsis cinerea okayama7\|eukprot:XP_001829353.1 hypothetical protein CC1G_00532 [Coprinopsis cinerea okayama7\
MSLLGQLPGELYSSIFDYLPKEVVQCTVLSLTRVFPKAAIPLRYLYASIRVRKQGQEVALNRHLRELKSRESKAKEEGDTSTSSPMAMIYELSVELWTVDADILVNIVGMLRTYRLKSLTIWIGPNNFSPEHLEEMFQRPIESLVYLGLRFRPYVKRATYYQFLKGAYFDTTISALARWPESSFPTLSIVQDPLKADPDIPVPGGGQSFAQPIVFFRLDPCISALLQSPALSASLNAFRLRVPSRPVVRALCYPPLMSENSDGDPVSTPHLEVLDLSTSNVLEGEVDLILSHYKDLKHLLLDDCIILRGELGVGEWSAMGKRCAMAGARRAKECEKALTAWYERRTIAAFSGSDSSPAAMPEQARRPRRGRRGLATATISIRDDPPNPGPSRPPAGLPREALPRFKILPPIPSLRTLCATTSSSVHPDAYETIRSEFEAGWAEGIAQLAVRRARLRESAKLGTKILRFSEGDTVPEVNEWEWNGMLAYAASHGLELVDKADLEAFDTLGYGSGDPKDIPTPILCLAGGEESALHVPGCGHSVVADLWPVQG